MSESERDFEAEAFQDEAEQRRGRSLTGRDMSPERKQARVRAQAAASAAAALARHGNMTVLPGGTYVLADNPRIAVAAGLAEPPWYVRLWTWLKAQVLR